MKFTLKKLLTLRALFLVEKQGTGKKRKFVRINLLVEIFLFVCVFFETKNKYILTHIRLLRVGR